MVINNILKDYEKVYKEKDKYVQLLTYSPINNPKVQAYVLFNGKPVTTTVSANQQEGWIDTYVTLYVDNHEEYFDLITAEDDQGTPILARLKGEVTILLKENNQLVPVKLVNSNGKEYLQIGNQPIEGSNDKE